MKRPRLKIILIGFFVLICFFGGGLFYVFKTKIKEKEIHLFAIEKIQQFFPRANVELSRFDIKIGFNISVVINKLSLNLPRANETVEIVSVDNFTLKIPILSFFTNQGSIEAILNKPKFTYLELGEKNNWQLAMENRDKSKTSYPVKKKRNQQTMDSERNNLMLTYPFLTNPNIDLKFKNILIHYGLDKGNSGEIKIGQFIVKNLGLDSPAAYELESNLNLTLPKEKRILNESSKVSLDVLLIGQFFLRDFLKNGSMESKAHLKISNVSFPRFDNLFHRITPFKSDINLKLNSSGKLQGRLESNFEKNIARLNFAVQQGKIELSNIEVQLLINDLISPMSGSNLNLNSQESFFNLKGNLVAYNEKLYPQFSFLTNPDISLNFNGEDCITGFKGTLSESDFTSEAEVKFLSGEAKVNLKAKIDLNSQNPLHKKVRNYNSKIDLFGMKFDKPFLKKILYNRNNSIKTPPVIASDEKVDSIKTDTVFKNLFLLPKGVIAFRWRDIEINGQNFSGFGKWKTHLNEIRSNSMRFRYGQGGGSLSYNLLMYEDRIKNKFGLQMKNLDLKGLNGLFPQTISEIEGRLGGKIEGTVNTGQNLEHDVKIDLKMLKGELKGMNINLYVQKLLDVITKIPILKDKIDSDNVISLNGDFEKLILKGQFRQNHYLLSKFLFQGIQNKIEVQAHGNIYPDDESKKGILYVNFKEAKFVSPQLKKQAQTEILPMLFKGPKLSLIPDYNYSLKKLAKSHLQQKKKKLMGDAKEKGRSKLEDLIKKEGKKLIKGFF